MTILWPNGETTPPPFSWEGHFGWRNAGLSYASSFHRGQDFYGFSTIHSVADGTVVLVGEHAGWYGGGNMVWIQHDGFFSRSLHMSITSAHVGQKVKAGDFIGWMGNTPVRYPPMAVHLHLEITPGTWHFGNYGQIDPRKFLEERVGSGSGGGGGSTPTPETTTPALDEEEDMRYIENTDTGILYQVAPEWINAMKPDSGREKAWRDAGLPDPVSVAQWSFERILAHYGCLYDGNTKIVNDKGEVWNALEGGGYERYGTWSRVRKIERRQWEHTK